MKNNGIELIEYNCLKDIFCLFHKENKKYKCLRNNRFENDFANKEIYNILCYFWDSNLKQWASVKKEQKGFIY